MRRHRFELVRPDMSWRDGEPLVRYEEELARPALARPVLVKRTHTVAPQPPFSLPTRAPTANGLGERERDPAMFEAAALAAARTLASTPATLSTPTQSSGKVRKIPSCRRGGVQVTQGCIDIAVVHSATSDTPSPQPPSPSFVSANRMDDYFAGFTSTCGGHSREHHIPLLGVGMQKHAVFSTLFTLTSASAFVRELQRHLAAASPPHSHVSQLSHSAPATTSRGTEAVNG